MTGRGHDETANITKGMVCLNSSVGGNPVIFVGPSGVYSINPLKRRQARLTAGNITVCALTCLFLP